MACLGVHKRETLKGQEHRENCPFVSIDGKSQRKKTRTGGYNIFEPVRVYAFVWLPNGAHGNVCIRLLNEG